MLTLPNDRNKPVVIQKTRLHLKGAVFIYVGFGLLAIYAGIIAGAIKRSHVPPAQVITVGPHPRIYFNQTMLDTTRCKVGIEGYSGAQYCSTPGTLTAQWTKYRTYAYSVANNQSATTIDSLKRIVFYCVVSRDPVVCNPLKQRVHAVALQTSPPSGNEFYWGHTNFWAVYYDHMHDQLDATQKNALRPILAQRAVSANSFLNTMLTRPDVSFRADWIGTALAIYGEGIDDALAEQMLEGTITYVNRKVLQMNEINHGGAFSGYLYKAQAFYTAAASLKSALNIDVWDESDFLRNVTPYFMYRTTPNRILASFTGKYDAQDPTGGEQASNFYPVHSYYYRDPATKKMADYWAQYCMTHNDGCGEIFFTFYDPSLLSGEYSTMPLTKNMDGFDSVFYRSNWKLKGVDTDYQDAIQGYFVNAYNFWSVGAKNHFIVNRGKDPLIIKGNYFPGDDSSAYMYGWNERSISHNTVVFKNTVEEENYGNFVWNGQSRPRADDGGALCCTNSDAISSCYDGDPSGNYCGDTQLGITNFPVSHQQGADINYAGNIDRYEDGASYMYTRGNEAETAFRPGDVQNWDREMVYLKPDVFVIRDLMSADPVYEKSVLFHTINRITLNGATTRVEGSDNGGIYQSTDSSIFQATSGESKIFGQTLFPEQKVMQTIGGANAQGVQFVQDDRSFDTIGYASPAQGGKSYEWYLGGKNLTPGGMFQGEGPRGYTLDERTNRNNLTSGVTGFGAAPAGDWRIQIKAQTGQRDENFLNVLWPTASTQTTMIPAERIISTNQNAIGAIVNSNRVVMFSATTAALTNTSFTVSASGSIEFLFVDLQLNTGYNITVQGHAITLSPGTAYTSSDQGVLSVTLNVSGTTPPIAPTITAARVYDNNTKLTWDWQTGVNEYDILFSISRDGSYSTVGTVINGVGFYNHSSTDIRPGQTNKYYYKITAKRNGQPDTTSQPLIADPTVDFNANGFIDAADFSAFITAFNAQAVPGMTEWNAGADTDENLQINLGDFVTFAGWYGWNANED